MINVWDKKLQKDYKLAINYTNPNTNVDADKDWYLYAYISVY